MEKLAYMKSSSKKFVQFVTPSRYNKQPKFEDKHLFKGTVFKHSWS